MRRWPTTGFDRSAATGTRRLGPQHVIEYSVVEGFTAIVTTYELARAGAGCRFTLRARSTARSLRERAVEPFAARTRRRQADRHVVNLAARRRDGDRGRLRDERTARRREDV